MTANAPWAARQMHTSVIDAAGRIYVLGGCVDDGCSTYYNDVWRSADQGAAPHHRPDARYVPAGAFACVSAIYTAHTYKHRLYAYICMLAHA